MGSDEGAVRPAAVAVGQRWLSYVIAHVCAGRCELDYGRRVACACEHVHYHDHSWDLASTLVGPSADPEYRYLGMSDTPPAPVGVVPAAGQCWRDLRGEYFGGAAFTLREPYLGLGWWTVETKGRNWIPSHAFTDGRLECLGRPAASVTPGTPPAPPPVEPVKREVPASCLMERWNESGPLTALEAIRARREPEPWRPSIDEFDLLPDAPGVTR